MDKLATFQSNDPATLLRLTKNLLSKNFFTPFLNHVQLAVLSRIVQVDSKEIWNNFLEGNIVLDVTERGEGENATEAPELDQEFVTQLVMKVRYFLWEKAIDFYYLNKLMAHKGVEEVSDDYVLIEELGHEEDVAEKEGESEPQPVREEEDDYDDEDEDEEDKSATQDTPMEKAVEVAYRDLKAVVEVPAADLTEDTKKEDDDNAASDGPVKLMKELNKAYHTFEYDRETLSKRRKLEKSNQQLDSEKDSEVKKEADTANGDAVEPREPPLGPVPFGLGSTSLRSLLSTIHTKRDQIPLNEHELRMLFMDVRKNRSKWANDDRVGQEELYEACERVVSDLRGYTEHSTPFLNKVSKREAPNYGLIIKTPMDLNTVMKKLKGLAYNSKSEFVDDLMLIWSNCLTYNADPKHFMRAHAIAMQKRTQKLVATIPDITIKNRLEIEKDEEDREMSVDPEARSGAGAGKGLQRHTIKEEVGIEEVDEQEEEREERELRDEEEEARETDEKETKETAEPKEGEQEDATDGSKSDSKASEPRSPEHEDSDSEVEADPTESQEGDQDWRLLTAKSRANYCSERAALFDSEYKLRLDAPAILRKSNEMQNFSHYLTGSDTVTKSSSLLDTEEPYILEYDVAGGLPGIRHPGVSVADQDRYEQSLVDQFLEQAEADAANMKATFALSQESGLNKVYTDSITEIQEIRKICTKIALVRQMQTQNFLHHVKQPEIVAIREVDVDPILKLLNHDPNLAAVQYLVLRRSVAKVAMQTGFETAEPWAINTLTQVAGRYLSNLIKTVKTHCELASLNHLSNSEVLLVSLVENGVNKPDDLYTFVKERVLKHQAKLKDLRLRLLNFLRDLLRPSLENFNERSFEDNSEQFVTGDFSSDLGDDFFGFKELGLDKEFKMLSLSIPIYLLHSRMHQSYASTGSELKRNKYTDLEDPEPFKLSAAAVQDEVGLVQPFFNQLVEKTKSFVLKAQKKKGESQDLPPDDQLYIIEDEELPQKQRNVRPRLPPTGKIAAAKKKLVSSGFFLPEVV